MFIRNSVNIINTVFIILGPAKALLQKHDEFLKGFPEIPGIIVRWVINYWREGDYKAA